MLEMWWAWLIMEMWWFNGEMWWLNGEMWWLIGCASDFWGRVPGIRGFESGISHNDPDVLPDPAAHKDHCDKVENLRVERETYP